MIVENKEKPKAGVKITIVHQRKRQRDEWENMESPPLTTLRAKEVAKISLDSSETLALYQELEQLYTIHEGAGVLTGRRTLIVAPEERVVITDPQRAEAIRSMIEQGYSQDIWDELVGRNPDLVTRLCYARMHAQRAAVLEEFEESMNEEKAEQYWQDFFEEHSWIFGYGLNYQILRLVEDQPYFGGQGIDGTGGQRGDFLCRTEALARFTILVEIKKPDTPLFGSERYRNGAWEIHSELSGGVTQLQANCRTWDNEGSREEKTHEQLLKSQTFTVEPDGILVIGHSRQFVEDPEKPNTFEMFRQSLHKPQIVTFDELYERAKFIVEQPAIGGQKRIRPEKAEARSASAHVPGMSDRTFPNIRGARAGPLLRPLRSTRSLSNGSDGIRLVRSHSRFSVGMASP
jgi:hypothetical protein